MHDPSATTPTHRSDATSLVPSKGVAAAHPLMRLQRQAGNRAVTKLVQRVCACHSCCAEAGDDQPGPMAAPAGPQVQRDPAIDAFDATLVSAIGPAVRRVIADKLVYDKTKYPTAAAALADLSNESIAAITRVANRITDKDPGLWNHVKSIKGGWVTDNYGMGVEWVDGDAAKTYILEASPQTWCRDDMVMSKWMHNTWFTYREVPPSPGEMSLHCAFAGSSDIHIDLHQPVTGKNFTGLCTYSVSELASHAGDVFGSGGGAKGGPIGRYGTARHKLSTMKAAAPGSVDTDKAASDLNAIADGVTRYAAMGKQTGDTFEGDKAMLNDRSTMSLLEDAEAELKKAEVARAP